MARQWLNEPPAWREEENELTVQTAPASDFWRVTALNRVRSNGHFYFGHLSGNFQMDVRVSGAFTGAWDQVGLMLYVNEKHWLKCSSEYFEGQAHACVVVTRERSDWSIVDLPALTSDLFLRLTREGETLAVSYALDGVHYRLQRLASLPCGPTVAAGRYAASPEGPGFLARWHDFQIQDYAGYQE